MVRFSLPAGGSDRVRLRSILGTTPLKDFQDSRFSDEVIPKVENYAGFYTRAGGFAFRNGKTTL